MDYLYICNKSYIGIRVNVIDRYLSEQVSIKSFKLDYVAKIVVSLIVNYV